MGLQVENRYVDLGDGHRLAYVAAGAGDRVIVYYLEANQHPDLLLTDASVAEAWDLMIRNGVRGLALQPRGLGLSDPGSGLGTLQDRADDVLRVMDAEGVESATLLATNSLGIAAGLVAAQHPRRIERLFLDGTPLHGPLVDPSGGGWTPETAAACVAWTRGWTWGAGETGAAWHRAHATEHARRGYGLSERASAPPAVAAEHWERSLRADGRAIWPQVRCPAYVSVLEDAGGALPAETQRALAAALPDGRVRPLPPIHPGDPHGEGYLEGVRFMVPLITGQPVRLETQRALATVLFTDVVDSTAHLARMGDGPWSALLGEHDRAVRRAAHAEGGRLVDTIGDGTLCEFGDPASALRAARAIQAVGRKLGVEIRAGVHTGEVERRGADLAGMAVHVGARVSGLSGGGEVVVSQTVRDLLAGAGEWSFASLGSHELKGVPDRWEVFAVAAGTGDVGVAGAPEPTAVDRAVLRTARRAPAVVRALGRLGLAAERRRLARS